MPFRIGYRTLKTAIGVGVAVAIAQMLNLDFYGSAAILALLCISTTKRDSVKASWYRIAACLIGLVVSSIVFSLIGYAPWALAVVLLLFIPIAVMWKVEEGIVTSAVIILHMYTAQEVTLSLIINELLLIMIGVGVALIMNAYMPSSERKLRHYHKEIEAHFKKIFFELAVYLRYGESDWDGKEIYETDELLKAGQNEALVNIHNHFLRYEDRYYYYFKMREKQFELLERLMPYISSIDQTYEQNVVLAGFLEELGAAISPANQVPYFLEKLEDIKKGFQKTNLPKTREEFEIRASLFYIMNELSEYLHIKDRLWNELDKKKL
ncbi:aromatic acid exporter family protein [Halalkalibacter sp. APA_J-10(15)]|uniref:aromatic acid exporter family protein n=1 Tax=Halalkalibacter sp. APA_J-10(15) TaxID=2933805 RepID=UPI001FF455E2|nr:aromatic acid exporter family protein [Halalkalibacter sp. APA_J-10(15)]MCK0471478.1 aromatic acid exporter family protein [Halalkalibacter sp. APA_J-10(15)]